MRLERSRIQPSATMTSSTETFALIVLFTRNRMPLMLGKPAPVFRKYFTATPVIT